MADESRVNRAARPPGNSALRERLKELFRYHLLHTEAKDQYTATRLNQYRSAALTVRDVLVRRWLETQQTYHRSDSKCVCYLSLEFLLGRMLGNNLINLGLFDEETRALRELGYRLEDLQEMEWDAGLGNGGLGRLAACLLDSLATKEFPAYGYGIRYEFGIFSQRIHQGYQIEIADNWLRYGSVWEVPRPDRIFLVQFYGTALQYNDEQGRLRYEWVGTDDVVAMAYDYSVPGYGNRTVNNLRLWSAKSTREFDLEYFNDGDYVRAVENKDRSELISKVLYPNDLRYQGKELRLKQEYFFVSATLQDIIRRHLADRGELDGLADRVAIQLNDTHPSIAVAELMRLLLDRYGLSWERAWEITVKTFSYTNHTVLPEACEKWPVGLLERLLPRHLLIIYEINRRFLEEVSRRFPGDTDRLRRMSLVEEGEEKRIRMAHLALVGSHAVNGVSALHSRILAQENFRDFYDMYPERFYNVTNGITQRRWLLLCNPGLAELISRAIGARWITELEHLKNLRPLADDGAFQAEWHRVKAANKARLADEIWKMIGVRVNLDSLFDCQVKRIHEYKRQLLNILHAVYLYNRIKAGPAEPFVPRTILFAGKAAPGYAMAKLIVKLIHAVAEVVNRDAEVGDRLKIVFLPNYGVSLAEKIIPGADLSEQISTAGTEASGTGNMKLALNGALTIGTLDGANIEIMEEVGAENIFIFGLTAEQIAASRRTGYEPARIYETTPDLKRVIDMIAGGYFAPAEPDLFKPLVASLLGEDPYRVLADFASYARCQEEVSLAYLDRRAWLRKSILNVAGMGKFSSDRTAAEYARLIWQVEPVPVPLRQEGPDLPGL
ncbi:MAG TPA: glycogen/starch/alpha-glucan phosphorylase [Candidatus Acidoferrales bacterium]|nr:glycogen/starch/alpha-glucan phosphorylase [Candidatus Acidoferrales bacterium]